MVDDGADGIGDIEQAALGASTAIANFGGCRGTRRSAQHKVTLAEATYS